MINNLNFSEKKIEYKSLFLLIIGLCPTLIVTTSVLNSLILGILICVVILFSNIVTNIIDKFIPVEIKGIMNIFLIMGVVTVISIVLEVFFLSEYRAFNIYLPLIGINSIFMRNNFIINKKDSFGESFKYEMIIGISLAILLVFIGSIREILGNGTIFGVSLFGSGFMPVLIGVSPAGALIITGFILALLNVIIKKIMSKKSKEAK